MEKINLDIEKLCPVCGYDFFKELGIKPWNGDSPSDEICPSCGFQFGLDDYDAEKKYSLKKQKYTDWRNEWINNGMNWSSKGKSKPESWNPFDQLKRIGIN